MPALTTQRGHAVSPLQSSTDPDSHKSPPSWATSLLTVGTVTLYDLDLSSLTPSLLITRAILAVFVVAVSEAARPSVVFVVQKAFPPKPKLYEDSVANKMAQLQLTDTEAEGVGDALLTQTAQVAAERDPSRKVLLLQDLENAARKQKFRGLVLRHLRYLELARKLDDKDN